MIMCANCFEDSELVLFGCLFAATVSAGEMHSMMCRMSWGFWSLFDVNRSFFHNLRKNDFFYIFAPTDLDL